SDYAFLYKIFEPATEPLSIIFQLEPKKLVRQDNVPIPRDTRVSPPIVKESTVTPVSKSLEFSANIEMADGAASSKSGDVFVQGVSRISNDVIKVTVVEFECVSSSPTDVVVALFVGGKGDVLIPSSVASEEVVINSSGV
nr:hypothetical protein [Tanacetum cinerariifolium]